MKSTILATALLSIIPNINALTLRDASSGCNTPLPNIVHPDQSINLTLPNSGDPPRRYRLHLPPGYDNTQRVPLILSFHGRTQDALYQENLSQFSNASYGFKGIAVYPEDVPLIKVNPTISSLLILALTISRKMGTVSNNGKVILSPRPRSTTSNSHSTSFPICKPGTVSPPRKSMQLENPTAAASPDYWLATLLRQRASLRSLLSAVRSTSMIRHISSLNAKPGGQ